MSESDFKQADAASAERAYAKAVDLLARRAHFRAELADKLARRGFAEAAVSTALERLTELGYLDDLEAARSFARERVERQGWGPARLRAELQRRRVEDEEVARVVAETYPDGETALARAVAERFRERGRGGADRLARHLDRRGFSKAVIVEILGAAERGEPHDHEEL